MKFGIFDIEIFDVEIPQPARFEFIQPGEFYDPYYAVLGWNEYHSEYVTIGALKNVKGAWRFNPHGYPHGYSIGAGDLKVIADKLDSLNRGV